MQPTYSISAGDTYYVEMYNWTEYSKAVFDIDVTTTSSGVASAFLGASVDNDATMTSGSVSYREAVTSEGGYYLKITASSSASVTVRYQVTGARSSGTWCGFDFEYGDSYCENLLIVTEDGDYYFSPEEDYETEISSIVVYDDNGSTIATINDWMTGSASLEAGEVYTLRIYRTDATDDGYIELAILNYIGIETVDSTPISYNVSFTSRSQGYWYKFTASEDGDYLFSGWETNEDDEVEDELGYAVLYSSDGEILESDYGFLMDYELSAGETVYLRVSLDSDSDYSTKSGYVTFAMEDDYDDVDD